MGVTPDRFTGDREDSAIVLEDRTADGAPTTPGELRRLGDSFQAVGDDGEPFDIREDNRIRRALARATTIRAGMTHTFRNLEIPNGLELIIEDGGEAFVL